MKKRDWPGCLKRSWTDSRIERAKGELWGKREEAGGYPC